MWRLLLLTGLLLSGCMATADDYSHPDTDEATFQREAAACELAADQTQTTGGMTGLGGALTLNDSYNRAYDACMRSKGYAAR